MAITISQPLQATDYPSGTSFFPVNYKRVAKLQTWPWINDMEKRTLSRSEHKQRYVTRQHRRRTHLSEPKLPAEYRDLRVSARLRMCGTNQVSSGLISPTETSK